MTGHERGAASARIFTAATVLVSVAVGAFVARSPVLLLVGVAAGALIMMPPRWKVAVTVASAQLPFTVGMLAGIANVLVIELLALPLLALAAIDSIRRGRPLLPRSGRLVSLFVAAFAAVAAFHAFGSGAGSLGNEVSAPNVRAYLDLFLGVAIFFATLYWADAESEWTDGPLLFIALLGLFVGVTRLFVYFTGSEMPLLGGRFQYDVVTSVSGVQAARIGGLTEAASFAVGGALGLWHRQRSVPVALACGVAGVLFAVISGGRSYAVGLVAGLLVYFTVLPGRLVWQRSLAMAVAGALAAISVVAVGLGAQLTRLSAFAGGIEAQDPARYTAMTFLWLEFLRAPFVGKGIGAPGLGIVNEFVADIVSSGGHSTYLSALANFGIVGLGSTVAVTAGGIGRSWYALRFETAPADHPVSGWLVLLLFVLVTRVFEFAVGGNGYSDFGMYAMGAAALGVALMARASQNRA